MAVILTSRRQKMDNREFQDRFELLIVRKKKKKRKLKSKEVLQL